MRRLLAIALLGLTATACGGSDGGGDEDAVRTAVERFFAHDDPRGCDVQTERFLVNSEDEADPAAARRRCREDESGKPSDELANAGLEPTRGAEASGEAVDGDKARARATLQGGDLDKQAIDVSLVKQGDDWKIDRLDGLEIAPALRDKMDRALGRYFRRTLRGDVADDKLEPTIACVLQSARRSVPNERLAMRFEGQLPPDSLNAAFEGAAVECLRDAAGEGGKTVAGTGYEATLPPGWRDVTKSSTSGRVRSDLVLASALGTINVALETDLPAGITLDQYFQAGRAKATAKLPPRPEPTTLAGVDAITYTFSDVTDKGRRVRDRQVVAIRDGVAYVVTFGVREERFDEEVRSLDAFLASWRWK
jgi:hypothetical protein